MTKTIHQVHDKLFKQSMADIRVAREFFEKHLPPEILAIVDLDTLSLQKNSFIDEAYQETEADMVYTVKMGDKLAYFYLLCENQSKVDDTIAFRLLVYTVRIIEMHVKQYPNSPLPIVYSMVIYTGKKPWNAPTDVFKLFGAQEDLARQILLQPYQLIDIQRMSDDELSQRRWSGLVEFVLKHRHVRNFAQFLETLLPWLYEVEIHQGANFATICY